MFAVVKTGGKQYRVTAGDKFEIERLDGEAGDIIVLDSVLMVGEGDSTTVGAPFIEGASVSAEIVEQNRGPKVIAFKKRRRQNSRRKRGHRQLLTTVRISEILIGGAKPSKTVAKPAAPKAAPVVEAKVEAAPAATGEVQALFTRPEGEPDDLKRISGVGPVLEKKLHSFGVTKFAQVAVFTKADIDMLDDALSFKGRIERDEWVKQAAEFAKEG